MGASFILLIFCWNKACLGYALFSLFVHGALLIIDIHCAAVSHLCSHSPAIICIFSSFNFMFLRIIEHDLRYLNKTIIMSLAVCPGNRKIFRSFGSFLFFQVTFRWLFCPLSLFSLILRKIFKVAGTTLKENGFSCCAPAVWAHFFYLLSSPLPLSFRFAPLSLDFFAPLNLFSIFSFFSPLFPLFWTLFSP